MEHQDTSLGLSNGIRGKELIVDFQVSSKHMVHSLTPNKETKARFSRWDYCKIIRKKFKMKPIYTNKKRGWLIYVGVKMIHK
jgi:hypothetical protein